MRKLFYLLLIIFVTSCSFEQNIHHDYSYESSRNPSSSDELLNLPSNLREFIYSEQILNDRIEDTSEFASIVTTNLDAEFLPENQPVFKLNVVLVPLEEVTILSTELDKTIDSKVIVVKDGKKYVKFYIHPKSVELYSDAFKNYQWTEEIIATPLSSHRSLIAWSQNSPDSIFGIKLSLNVNIGGVVRNLSRGQIEHAYIVSSLVKTFDKKNLKKKGIVFLDESINVIPNSVQYGYTLRDIPLSEPNTKVMPMFSLYSKGVYKKTPLLAEIISKNKVAPKEYISSKVIKPLVDNALFMFFSEGLVGEYHEQNVLVEIKNENITGILWYRDLAGFSINKEFRMAAGKDLDFIPSGVQVKNLHMDDHSDIFRNIELDIRKSNLYALQVSMSEYFPEITKDWVMTEFEKVFIESVRNYTGVQTTWKMFNSDIKKILNQIKLRKNLSGTCHDLINIFINE